MTQIGASFTSSSKSNMAKTRAAGGGRKPLTTTEPTVKVAITLLASQAEAMKQLGDGNLSAGIRKAIENMSNTNHKYYAWASNDQGASLDVTLPMSERRQSMRAYEDAARNQLGSGWQVHIMKVWIDGDGQSVMGQPEEVKTFTIR